MIQAKMMASRRLSKTLTNRNSVAQLHQRLSQRSEPSVAALQNIPWTARDQRITSHERVPTDPTMQLLIDKGKRHGHYVTESLKQSISASSLLRPQENLNLKIKSSLVEMKHLVELLPAYDDHKEQAAEETSNGQTGGDYRDIPYAEAIDHTYEPVVQNPQVTNQLITRQNKNLKIYNIKYGCQRKNNIKMIRKVEKPNKIAQSPMKIGALAKYGHKGFSKAKDGSTSEKISFFIRLPSGQTIQIRTDPCICTVSDLRMKIWSKVRKRDLEYPDDIECTSVNIYYRGRIFGLTEKYNTIAEMGIKPFSTLETSFNMLGGSEHDFRSEQDIQLNNTIDDIQTPRTSANDLLLQLFSQYEELKQNKLQFIGHTQNSSDNRVQTLQATPVLKEFQKYLRGFNLDNAQVMKLAIKLGLSGRQRDILSAFCTHQLRQTELLLLLPIINKNQKRSLLNQLVETLQSKIEGEILKQPKIVKKEAAPDKQYDQEEREQSNDKEQAQEYGKAKIEKDSNNFIGSQQPFKRISQADQNQYRYALEKIKKLLLKEGDIDLQDEEFHGEKIADLWFKFAHQKRQNKLCEESVKICEDMTQIQWCSIFLEILKDQQFNAIFEALSEKRTTQKDEQNNQGVSQAQDFWSLLSQEQRIRIWMNLTEETKIEILSIPSKIISQEQTLDLWSDIICLREAKIWEPIDEEQCQLILEKMETPMKIAIWQQISKEEQLELYRNLDKKDEFWNQASFQQQETILEGLEENEQDILQLLQLLDQETLSISVCMHPNRLTQHLTKQQKKSVEEYQKYGVSSTTDKDKEKFVEDLMNKQYEDFNSLKLLKNKGKYLQIIKNPRLEGGLIIVQDFTPNFKYDDSQECLCLQIFKKKKAEVLTKIITNNELHEQQNECLHQKQNVVRQLQGQEIKNKNFHKYGVQRSQPFRSGSQVISYWSFIDQVGLYCTHSFVAPRIRSRLICSQDGEVFFITKKGKNGSNSQTANPSQKALQLHFLNHDRPIDTNGDRELKNNCNSHRILLDDHFAKSFNMYHQDHQKDDSHTDKFCQQVPTLIKIHENLTDPAATGEKAQIMSEEEGDNSFQKKGENYHKILVYKYDGSDQEKGIFFFQVKSKKTVARIAEAVLFIDSFTIAKRFFIRYMTKDQLRIRQIDINLLISDTQEDTKQELQTMNDGQRDIKLNDYQFQKQLQFRELKKVQTIQVTPYDQHHPTKLGPKTLVECQETSFQILVEDSDIEIGNIEIGKKSEVVSITMAFCKNDDKQFKATSRTDDANQLVTIIDQETKLKKVFTQQDYKSATWLYPAVSEDKKDTQMNEYDLNDQKADFNFKFDKQIGLVSSILKLKDHYMGVVITEDDHLMYFSVNEQELSQIDQKFNIKLQKYLRRIEISYPIVAYAGIYPDNRDIIIGNLADSQYPQEIIKLPYGRQLICFAGVYENDKIKLLTHEASAKDKVEKFYVCDITKPFPFKKRKIYGESSDITIQSIELNPPKSGNVKKKDENNSESQEKNAEEGLVSDFDFRSIKFAEFFFDDLKNDDKNDDSTTSTATTSTPEITEQQNNVVQQAHKEENFVVICQTSNSIWRMSNHKDHNAIKISKPTFSIETDFKRCRDRSLYWIEYFKQSQVSTLRRLSKKAIIENHELDKITTQDLQLVDVKISDLLIHVHSEDQIKTDQIFILDKEDTKLYSYKVDENEKSRIEQLNEPKNLSGLLNVNQEWLESYKMPRLYLERDKNQNYKLDTPWSIYCVQSGGIVYHNFETEASSMICTQNEGFLRKMNLNKDGKYEISFQKKIRNTNRRMGLLNDVGTSENYMICYNSPESREHDLLGYLGNSKIKQAKFISQDKVLVNLYPVQDYQQNKSKDQRNAASLADPQASSPQPPLKDQRNNWTIVDTSGQIKQLPRQLTDDWELSSWSYIDQGTFLIFKNRDSYRYLEFNLRGEISNEQYLEDLKIGKILQNQYDRQISFYQSSQTKISPLLKDQIDSSDNGMGSSLKISEHFLIDRQGRVFKLATKISGRNDNNFAKDKDPFSLFGAFLLKQISDEKLRKQEKDEEYLTVLIFNCQSEEQSKAFLDQNATICGDYLCYQTYTISETVCDSSSDPIEESGGKVSASVQDKNDVFVLDKLQSHEVKDNKLAKKDSQNITKKTYIRMFSLSEIKSKVESSIVERSEFTKQNKEQQLDNTKVNHSSRILLEKSEFSINDPMFDQVFGFSQNQQKLDYKSWLWIKDSELIDKKKMGSQILQDDEDHHIYLNCVQNSMSRFAMRTKDTTSRDSSVDSLLQVTLSNKVLLYDLYHKKPKQVYGIFDTNFFKDKENFVELGIQYFLTKKYTTRAENEQPTKHVWHNVTASPSKAYYMVKDISYEEMEEAEDDKNQGEENENEFALSGKEETFLCLHKTYSTMDLQALQWLIICLGKDSEEDKSLQRSQFQSTMASFKGHNVFSIFREMESNDNIQKIIELITKELNSLALLNDSTETQGKDYVYMRKLYRIFTMPTPQFKGQKFSKIDWGLRKKDEDSKSRQKEKLRKDELLKLSRKDHLILNQLQNQTPYTTILRDCIYFKQSVRDKFLQLASKNWEFMLSDFAIEQTMTGHMIMKYSSVLHQFFVDQINGVPMTSKIVEMKWPAAAAKIKRMTFRRRQSFISEEKLQKEIVQHFKDIGVSTKKMHQSQVEVKVLNADWLLHGGVSLIDFSYKLFGTSSERIFETEFMQVLVQGFWYTQTIWIKGFCFVPWVIYMMSTLCLFSLVLNSQYEDNTTNLYYILKDVSSTITLLLLVLQYYIKLMQMRARGSFSQKSLKDFFSNMMNIIDLFQYGSTTWITLANLTEEESGFKKEQRILAAFSVFSLFLKAFDWLRLFDSTSFYIKLLTQTFRDIEAFMILLFAGLSMIGCSMFMLSLNTQEDKDSVITPVFDVFILDSILNQYMLALGEFQMDAFNENPQWYLCYIFFLMATFVTQVTMFNMLIAIMGNTFSMVIENREIHATMQKLQIMSEYSQVFWFKQQEDLKNYLFVVKIVVDEGEQGQDPGDWEGGFSQIKKTLTKKIDNLDRKFTDSLKASAYRQKVLMSNLNSSLNVEMKQIRSQISISRDETKSIHDMLYKLEQDASKQTELVRNIYNQTQGDYSDQSEYYGLDQDAQPRHDNFFNIEEETQD